ncbi:hypothetical protein P170DRAFT_475630 [Aspergillus steynii IBT 23096]|uniref:Uncharacterized protein n=1 Tax=Aspergillus steynii IBT 23096 TaxID=1392250 RepID=A0A2I2G8Y1_9EURO|nr:uncharacterized protein P170DRAFT_475630 [Aspergillus steynii IBT 23096]PLB49331.1 hypothetical protein P170DRAFT_475630 [Aspergillus steynii IBT 23096]
MEKGRLRKYKIEKRTRWLYLVQYNRVAPDFRYNNSGYRARRISSSHTFWADYTYRRIGMRRWVMKARLDRYDEELGFRPHCRQSCKIRSNIEEPSHQSNYDDWYNWKQRGLNTTRPLKKVPPMELFHNSSLGVAIMSHDDSGQEEDASCVLQSHDVL